MQKDNHIYLEHILSSFRKIMEYVSGVSEAEFLKDSMMQDAVIRQFEVIGEATKQLSKEFREKYNSIPWDDMAGMRDKLIHDYIDVDLFIVWKTAKQDVPELTILFQKII